MLVDYTSWYSKLKKPSWAPPESLFGQVWSILYPIIFAVNIYIVVLVSSGKISWRILRCNPWSAGGYDPVDPEQNKQKLIHTNY